MRLYHCNKLIESKRSFHLWIAHNKIDLTEVGSFNKNWQVLFKIVLYFMLFYHITMYHILLSIMHTFFIEKHAEILCVRYTWKVAFTILIHKQSIQVKL
jgi:hypothetical protein